MGKIRLMRINLTKANALYMPGEKVTGSLEIEVEEKLKIDSICLILKGFSKVRWYEQRSNGKSSYTVVYSEYEEYLNSNTILIEKQEKNDLFLEVGFYTYPFTFILPEAIPSSFEHSVGKIRYSLTGTVSIPWSFDKHTVRSFTVISHVDLNQLSPFFKQPAQAVATKSVLFSLGGPINGILSVKKGCFVPGEAIVCSARIENSCNRDIIRSSVSLVQELFFTGSSRELIVKTTKRKKCNRNIVTIQLNRIISGNSNEQLLQDQMILIPPVCASSTGLSKIIEINYWLVFTFGVFGSLDRDVWLPLKIGTIPLMMDSQRANTNDNNNLPTYEECQLENETLKESKESKDSMKGDMFETDEKTFKPIYPYFKDFVN